MYIYLYLRKANRNIRPVLCVLRERWGVAGLFLKETTALLMHDIFFLSKEKDEFKNSSQL